MDKDNRPVISVIVPVYNVEKYLRQCIDSILKQSFQNFELLLIDDGSPDESGKICDEYAAKDGRVRVFHKENGGVSSARNMGLDNAAGQWVAFVDSDDYVGEDYLANLFKYASDDTGLVINRFIVFRDSVSGDSSMILPPPSEIRTYACSDYDTMLKEQNLDKNAYSCSKLYRVSSVVEYGIRFLEKFSFCEDWCFAFSYLNATASTVVFAPDADYYYRNREGSLVHSVQAGSFRKAYSRYVKTREIATEFAGKYNCNLKDFDVAMQLHFAIMASKSVSDLKSITPEDWDFFFRYFRVFTKKTKADRQMFARFRQHPAILLQYVRICRSFRNTLARLNLWSILDSLKK